MGQTRLSAPARPAGPGTGQRVLETLRAANTGLAQAESLRDQGWLLAPTGNGLGS